MHTIIAISSNSNHIIYFSIKVSAIFRINLDIFQCPDPAEVHVYHDKFCDPLTTKKQYEDCLKSRAAHYGPKTLLYYLYFAPESNTEFVDENLS